MPAPTKVVLQGGNFQDAEGNLLALGTLRMELVQDEQLSSDTGQICSGITLQIKLDSSGDVAASPVQSVWPTDVMTPAGASYTVWGYSAAGQLVWGPNYGLLVPSGATFDTGTWIPNTTGGGSGSSGGGITLQTNEVNNGNQQLLDLHAGSNITLVDNGSGRVTISASGGAAGDVFFGGQTINPGMLQGPGNVTVHSTDGELGVCILNLDAEYTINDIVTTWATKGGIPGNTALVGIYSSDGNTLLLDCGTGFDLSNGSVPVSAKVALSSPVILAPGSYLFVWGCHGSAFTNQVSWYHDQDSAIANALNQTAKVFIGTAANSITVGGRLPATLGALTPASAPMALPGFAFI